MRSKHSRLHGHYHLLLHDHSALWLKQMIAELHQAMALVRDDALVEAYKILARVSRIQAVMTLSWDVLTTMTPSDYTRFRGVLGGSSGFQSDQFRTVEFLLGLKAAGHLDYQADRPEARAARLAAENRARRQKGQALKLPEENYYGWLVNQKRDELEALVAES